MMFNFLSRRKHEEGLLSEAQAIAMVNAELSRRSWQFPEDRGYEIKRVDGRTVWRCMSFAYYSPGGGKLMCIDLDARTGEVVFAYNGRREDETFRIPSTVRLETTNEDA